MSPASLTTLLKAEAGRLGFDTAGVTPAATPERIPEFLAWLSAGFHGEMSYLSERAEAYRHPRGILEGARSLVLLTLNYQTTVSPTVGPGEGRVARYAWGFDYHDVIRAKLQTLSEFLKQHAPQAAVRGVVDTAPLLERDFAQLSGLGWIGKNTLLLNRTQGSYFFLAALITDLELEYDTPYAADHCGTCTACLDACPTGAFPAPYVLDATRCISYLTIEARGPIPDGFRTEVSDWVFGCDICQEVCPWNRKAPYTAEAELQPLQNGPLDLAGLFFLSETEFRQRFRKTPLWRPKRRGLLRNAAISLGNRPVANAVPALVAGLNDTEPLVRGAAAWALGRYGLEQAETALRERSMLETDPQVAEEITAALNGAGARSLQRSLRADDRDGVG